MDYSKTLNLPKTAFKMKANLPNREPELLKHWDENNIYGKVQAKNAGRPKFVLHDGPPYANGHIHLGTALNKILKDIIIKYHSMAGYDAPYTPGWDTHGLPIEQQAIKNLGINRHKVHPVDFRQRCKDYALKFVEIQKKEFRRLGVRGDWDNSYLTLMPHFEARQLEVFGAMANKGYIYKGLKPVYWCASCETALAEAEVEYAEKESMSITVRFPVVDGRGILPEGDTYFAIWTTTPWTIPGNVAITLHPSYEYVLIKTNGIQYVLAKELLDSFAQECGFSELEIIQTFVGRELEGIRCRHPLDMRDSLVTVGDHVTLEQGTGCVHTAPGHGHEDFIVGQKYKLPIISPVDARGYFTDEGGIFAGLFYRDADEKVVEELEHRGMLLNMNKISHQYPHCWRCKQPVFFRATEQWFVSVDGFRQDALDEIRRVRWIPAWGEGRIYNMIESRGDWCISRQRIWGVPIPIFYCAECDTELVNEDTISYLKDLFMEHGSNVWFDREAKDLMPPGTTCPVCGAKSFTKETDTMDVWFDSGSSHLAVLDQPKYWPDLRWPADLYLEGSDQHRGWFNSSLSTSVAVTGQAPYKAVLTHGFVVDEKGRKMSKSLGNVVDPLKVIQQMGADILRLWVSSTDYRGDLALSQSILRQMTEAYRKIRNTCRFLLGNLYDFDPAKDQVNYDDLEEIDRWALGKLQRLIQKVMKAYDDYEFHTVYHAIHNYSVVDMSSLYLDIIKDRLYTMPAASVERRGAQTVLYETVTVLAKLLAPILTFTCEDIWSFIPGKPGFGENDESVQLADMPVANEEYIDTYLLEKWEGLLKVRGQVIRLLEKARQDKMIGNALEASVTLYASGELYDFLEKERDRLDTLFIVSQVKLCGDEDKPQTDNVLATEIEELFVVIEKAAGEKCARCWMYNEGVGGDTEHPELCPRCSRVVKEI